MLHGRNVLKQDVWPHICEFQTEPVNTSNVVMSYIVTVVYRQTPGTQFNSSLHFAMSDYGPSKSDTCMSCNKSFGLIENFYIRQFPHYHPGDVPHVPYTANGSPIRNRTTRPEYFKCVFCHNGVRL